MSTSGGYHEYIGDIMSTLGGGGGQYIEGNHDACRGDIMSTSGDIQYIGVIP